MTQRSLSCHACRMLAVVAFLLASHIGSAQESQSDPTSVLTQRQQAQQAMQSMDDRQRQEVQTVQGLQSPAELRTNLPPMSEGTDAAELLGTGYRPGDDAMFGEQLFQPGVSQVYGVGFNANYVLAIGDRVTIRMWGAFAYQDIQVVDAQGNVFLPNVGPVNVSGVRNNELNEVLRAAVREVYRSNVEIYASLEASQPVRVFVTGSVRAPGQYPGVAADSILGFLLRAGGIDPDRGSYIDIRLLRGGVVRGTFNLYDFLLDGELPPLQIQDGDTIVVGGRHNAVRVTGDVFNTYGFEFTGEQIAANEVLQLARPKPGATHVSVVHKLGTSQFSEYHAIEELNNIYLRSGDEISVVSDRTIATILVRVDGAIDSSRVLTLPYGSTIADALAQIRVKPEATEAAVQLFRESLAERQREMLQLSLRVLEANALTSRSMTAEEAALRTREAAQITDFIDRARQVQPRGQVVLAGRESVSNTLLEDGDVLVIPERSSIVMVHGEVTRPSAITYDSKSSVSDYVELAGGTIQRRKDARILLLRQNGTFIESGRARPEPGDEILVLPTVGARKLEVARGISEILFQIAIVASVVLDL